MNSLKASENQEFVGKLAIYLQNKKNVPRWKAKAFEQHFYRELGKSYRIELSPLDDFIFKSCPNTKTQCLLTQLKQRNVHIFIRGQVYPKKISLYVYEVFGSSVVDKKVISIAKGVPLVAINRTINTAIKVFTQKGGALDQYQIKSKSLNPQIIETHPKSPLYIKIGIFLLFSIFFSLPLLLHDFLGLDWKSREHKSTKNKIKVQLVYLLAVTSLLFCPAWAISSINSAFIQLTALDLGPYSWVKWPLSLVGGMVWGSIVIFHLKLLIPKLLGLENIKHWNLKKLLLAWPVVFLLRLSVLSLIYIPILAFVWWSGRVIGLNDQAKVIIYIPLCYAILNQWLLVNCDVMAHFLDRSLGAVTTDERVVWHKKIKKYFIAYLKRIGLSLDRSQIDRVQFIPCTGTHLTVYAGGFGPPRVAININILKLAMGELDNEDKGEDFDSKNEFYFNSKTYGLYIPSRGEKIKRPIRPNLKKADHFIEQEQNKFKKGLKLAISNEGELRKNGHNDLAFGLMLPTKEGETLPLVSNDDTDFFIVDELITEHHEKYQQLAEDLEYDDTNPNDKDFLFGPLLYSMGLILRGEHYFNTVKSCHFQLQERYNQNLNQVAKFFENAFVKLFSPFYNILRDSYPALNGALHHYIQFLYYRLSFHTRYLTNRANIGEISKNTKEILTQVQGQLNKTNIKGDRKLLLRLVKLSSFTNYPINFDYPNSLQRAFKLIMLAIIIFPLSIWCFKSVQYHDVYTQKVIELKKEIKSKKELDHEKS